LAVLLGIAAECLKEEADPLAALHRVMQPIGYWLTFSAIFGVLVFLFYGLGSALRIRSLDAPRPA
jgi:hypothetical protein